MGDDKRKPEELVKAMEALKMACASIHPEFAENPGGEKPAGLGKQKNAIYDVMKGVYAAIEGISNYLGTIGFQEERISKLEEETEKIAKLEEVTRMKLNKLEEDVGNLASDKDVLAQKRKTGTIILQSNKKGKNPLVKPDIEKEEDLAQHAIYLVKEKTGVAICPEDLSKFHYVPGGGLKLRFKEVRRGSKFQEVVDAIKKPSTEQRNLNLFANFELTKMRNSLLFEVRKAKKENRLAKYFVDYDGAIEVQLNLEDKARVRLTRQMEVMRKSRDGGGFVNSKQPDKTFTAESFKQFLNSKTTAHFNDIK